MINSYNNRLFSNQVLEFGISTLQCSKSESEQLRVLLENREDFKYFMDNIFELNKSSGLMIYEMKEYKKKINSFTFDEFNEIYEVNQIKALEKYFFEPMTEALLKTFQSVLSRQGLTIRDVYEKFRKGSCMNLMQAVL